MPARVETRSKLRPSLRPEPVTGRAMGDTTWLAGRKEGAMNHDPETARSPRSTRRPFARWMPFLVLPAVVSLAAIALPAGAIPGPDPPAAAQNFSIVISIAEPSGPELLHEVPFDRAQNWDFGDRRAYRCAFVEYIVGGEVLFRLEFERLAVPDQAENYVVINDRHGMESGEGGQPEAPIDNCGLPERLGGPRVWDGSPFVAGGASFTLFRDGQPLTSYSLPAVAPNDPDAQWSVGNDPGEAYLWYAEPGENSEALLRFLVIPQAPGVALSPVPPSPTPSPSPTPGAKHDSTVTLGLEGRLRAFGVVRVPDGTTGCRGRPARHHRAARLRPVDERSPRPDDGRRRLQGAAGRPGGDVPGERVAADPRRRRRVWRCRLPDAGLRDPRTAPLRGRRWRDRARP